MKKYLIHLSVFCLFLKKQCKKIATIVICIVSTTSLAWSSNLLTESQWQDDISFYLEQLEHRHINLFHTTTKAHFYDEVTALRKQLPTLSTNDILVRLMGITRQVGDGHTAFPLWGPKLHKFPFKLVAIDQRFFVSATTHDNQHLLKSELVAINGRPISSVYQSFSKLVPFTENAYSAQVRVAQYIPMAEVLNGAGVIDADYSANFTFKQDETLFQQRLHAHVSPKYDQKPQLGSFNPSKVASANEWLWFAASPDKRAVYIKFERYTNLKNMKKFATALLRFINTHQSEHVIIDLRNNYGGDFFVGLKLAQSLVLADSLNWQSGNYVLINNVTFSAAMSNAAQFSQILNAKLVGSPTGAKPKGYQDMGEFTLPHSQRVVTYSKRYYDFMGNDMDAIYPDKTINVTVDDYQNNSDKQLEWVLRQVGW